MYGRTPAAAPRPCKGAATTFGESSDDDDDDVNIARPFAVVAVVDACEQYEVDATDAEADADDAKDDIILPASATRREQEEEDGIFFLSEKNTGKKKLTDDLFSAPLLHLLHFFVLFSRFRFRISCTRLPFFFCRRVKGQGTGTHQREQLPPPRWRQGRRRSRPSVEGGGG